ncbi:ABC transporter permease subunit [Puniceicoccus vermicola]|uniref:ABC transporter permease subunit n=1 Tax=Puniceicoccus vermicola TaxID=388746 RepID=A0A7X1AUQ0_9BACT|nr:ABC transporter permease subunit [Puniceicoccus vermicola]
MKVYFLKRLLLVIPTLIGITLVVFAITRFLPGGPVEQALMQGQMADGETSRTSTEGIGLAPGQIEQLESYYGFDKPWYAAYVEWLGQVVQGDLGRSYRYQVPVTSMILERMPVSAYYGVITFILTYSICVPLGILKAIKHRTHLDGFTSIVVFTGYAIPGYVLAALLLVFFAFQLEWFPTGGFVSPDFAHLSFPEQVKDLVSHSVLPLVCYMIGSFAFLTLLMKNSLLDNLAADYMRTATAKGLSFRRSVFRHALRNSLIPIATNFGNALSIFVAGSFLIEKIFSIDGMGLLGYNSLMERDYPVVMGILLISSILLLIGNILSDMLVASVDPRVRFD